MPRPNNLTRKALALLGGSETWKPTPSDRERVRMYVWAGIAPHKIAGFLRITEPELRYHFYEEMGVQQADMRARIVVELNNMIVDPETPKSVKADLLKYMGDRQVPSLAPRKAAEAPEAAVPDETKQLQPMTKDEIYSRIAELRAKKEEPSE